MRFFEDGPNIPDELLKAQDEHRVIFFCGAGVSCAYAGLPNFAALASAVLDGLGATEDSEERQLFRSMADPRAYGASADRIFSALERNFDPDLISREIAAALRPKGRPNLAAHKALLSLAALPGGGARLVTTNFDRLFESCDPSLPSVTRARLPRVAHNDGSWGIVHLHGCVTSDHSEIDSEGLVLSSAEFGDAYLAEGWARDFVSEILERYVAVFVGYSADDPPVRYLLEGLSKSRAPRYGLYAFQAGEPDEAIARWDSKNVTAISYQPSDSSHSVLYQTLQAWAKRSSDPVAWRTRVLNSAVRGPERLAPHQRGMVAHIVKSPQGAIAFSQHPRPLPPEWLCVFDKKIRLAPASRRELFEGETVDPFQLFGLDDDPRPSDDNEKHSKRDVPADAWDAFELSDQDRSRLGERHIAAPTGHNAWNVPNLPPRLSALADWVVRISDRPATLWWAGAQSGLHPQIAGGVRRTLSRNQNRVRKAVRLGWRHLLQVSPNASRDFLWEYEAEELIARDGWSDDLIRHYAQTKAPQLVIQSSFRSPVPPGPRERAPLRRLVQFDVHYPERPERLECPPKALPTLTRAFRSNVETAIDLEFEVSAYVQVSAIEPARNEDEAKEDPHHRMYGLSGYVLRFVDLFKRLAETNAKAAKDEWRAWRRSDPVFQRLRLWAASYDGIGTPDAFLEEFLAIPPKTIWRTDTRRDVLLALERCWRGLAPKERAKVEKKILAGPAKFRGESDDDHAERSAHDRLNVLHWMQNHDCALSFSLDEFTEELRKEAPNWKASYADGAADGLFSRSGWVKTVSDPTPLRTVPISEIVTRAKEISGRRDDYLTEYDPFKGLCETEPRRAFLALMFSLRRGEFEATYWERFLNAEARKEDPPRLRMQICARLSQLNDADFASISLTISRWFEVVAKDPEVTIETWPLSDLWDKFVSVFHGQNIDGDSALLRQGKDVDWATEAINSSTGNLAQILVDEPGLKKIKKSQGFPSAWKKRADQLLGLPGNSARYPLVIFAFQMSWFFHLDPDWTGTKILSLLETDNDAESRDAVWAGFFWGARIPRPTLYKRLKPLLISMACQPALLRRRHGEILSALLLAGWGSKSGSGRFVSSEELRAVLLSADEEFRSHMIWQLGRWCEDENWSKQLPEFLRDVWPKQKKAKTPKVAGRLADLVFGLKHNFPQAVAAVLPLLSATDPDELIMYRLREREGAVLRQHPKQTLELLHAILPENPRNWPYGASALVSDLLEEVPSIAADPKMAELRARLSQPPTP